jgi:hypothetical protein
MSFASLIQNRMKHLESPKTTGKKLSDQQCQQFRPVRSWGLPESPEGRPWMREGQDRATVPSFSLAHLLTPSICASHSQDPQSARKWAFICTATLPRTVWLW